MPLQFAQATHMPQTDGRHSCPAVLQREYVRAFLFRDFNPKAPLLCSPQQYHQLFQKLHIPFIPPSGPPSTCFSTLSSCIHWRLEVSIEAAHFALAELAASRFTNLTLSAEHARIQSGRICRDADLGAVESLSALSVSPLAERSANIQIQRFLFHKLIRTSHSSAHVNEGRTSPLCALSSVGSCLPICPKQTVILNCLVLLAGDECEWV